MVVLLFVFVVVCGWGKRKGKGGKKEIFFFLFYGFIIIGHAS